MKSGINFYNKIDGESTFKPVTHSCERINLPFNLSRKFKRIPAKATKVKYFANFCRYGLK